MRSSTEEKEMQTFHMPFNRKVYILWTDKTEGEYLIKGIDYQLMHLVYKLDQKDCSEWRPISTVVKIIEVK